LLAAWSVADAPARERGEQVRNTVRWIHSEDGRRWSAPAALSDLAPGVSQGLPAVASTQRAWHVLAYEAGSSRTTVRIHSARHDTLAFRPGPELATRGFGSNDLFMHGNYQLRQARDIAIVGDYVGLAGSADTLASAIVLPENDDWQSPMTAYAAILDT
jgi:hypothetical protein